MSRTTVLNLLSALLFLLPSAAPAQTIVVLSDHGTRRSPVFETAAAHQPDLVIQAGDFNHSNPGFADTQADAVARARRMHDRVRFCVHPPDGQHVGCQWAETLGPFPFINTWDDHDYCTNNSDRLCPWRTALIQEFKRAYPDVYPGAGVWRERIEGNVHVILLDLRSARDPNGRPEPKTMMGIEQKLWLADVLHSSPSPWKLVISSVPWNASSGKPADSWRNFPTEQAEILALLRSVPGVILATGDMHSCGGIDDGRNTGGIPEINVPHTNVGPLHLLGQVGHWSHGILSGTECDGGYALITASATSLTMQTRFSTGAVSKSLRLTK